MKGWLGALKKMSDETSPHWEPVAKFYDLPVYIPDATSRAYNTSSSGTAVDFRKWSGSNRTV
jgi:hypothetical protein